MLETTARSARRLADLAQSKALRLTRKGLSESLDRLQRRFAAQSERLMVDGHDQARAGIVGHRDCLLGSAVCPDPRIVRTDGHDGGIEGTKAPVCSKNRSHCRIARNQQPPAFTFQHKARITSPLISADTGTPMPHLDGPYANITTRCQNGRRFIPTELRNGAIAASGQQIRGRPCHHRGGTSAHGAQRWPIEMVEMRVRDEHEIELRDRRAGQCTVDEPRRTKGTQPELHANAAEQHRIRKNSHAVEVDENRGMSQPGEREGVITPRLRMRDVWRGGGVMAAFGEALAKETRPPSRPAAKSSDLGLFYHRCQ